MADDEHPDNSDHPRLPKAVNFIPGTSTTPADLPVVGVCPYCGQDITRVCLGRYVQTPRGAVVELLYPARCPECNHPLLYMAGPGKVVRPHGLVG